MEQENTPTKEVEWTHRPRCNELDRFGFCSLRDKCSNIHLETEKGRCLYFAGFHEYSPLDVAVLEGRLSLKIKRFLCSQVNLNDLYMNSI